MKKIVRVLDEGMDATKVERASHHGMFVDERSDTDHGTRARAAEQTRDLLGLDAPRKAETGAVVYVPVIIAEFARPREVREIIEVKPVSDRPVADSPALPDSSPDVQVADIVGGEIDDPDLELAPTPTPQNAVRGARGGPKSHGR